MVVRSAAIVFQILGAQQIQTDVHLGCPPDGAVNVRRDADLMFLEAYRCTRHAVWFGDSPGSLERIAELTNDATNVVTPPEMVPGKTYCWRVDALRDGIPVPGAVWRFTVEE